MERNTYSLGLARLLVVLTVLFTTPLSVKAATTATGTINVSTRYQVLEGFGASGAWYESDVVTYGSSHPEIYNILFRDLGLDIYRVRNTYLIDSGYITRTSTIVSNATTSLGYPPRIMISSWSPPAYLKSNDSTREGTLKKDAGGNYMYTDFAQWWRNSLAAWSSAGVNAYYINMQNEPDYTNPGWDTCKWDPTENLTNAGYKQGFTALYNKLNSEMPNHPKLLAPEAVGINSSINYITALTETDKSNVYGYAHHLYGGGDMASFAASYGYKPLLQTEYASSDSNTFTGAMNLAILMHNSLTVEKVVAYLYWDLFWTSPSGLVTISSSSYTINPVYYAFKHYSAFTDPNWQRIDASTSSSDLRISAYISPDSNHLSAVIINTSTSTDVNLSFTINNITIVSGNIYRTNSSLTEKCSFVGAFDVNTLLLTVPKSSITTIAMTTSLDTTPPAAPTGLSATASDEIVWLDWNDNDENDLAGYNIYRGYSYLGTSLPGSPNYTDSNVTNGTTYYYVVTAVDTSTNESIGSSEVSASPSAAVGAMGTILREWWLGIAGGSVSDLTLDPNFLLDNPTNTKQIKSLEGPTNWADSYGARISGYLHPPETGSYTFWIASDANSELRLSTDGSPENVVLIANVPGFTNPRDWNDYPQQESSPISLNADHKYYIEVLHKEDTGNDNVAVAWQGPGIAPRQVIYGTYLSPYFTGFYGDFTHNGKIDMNDLADFIELWLDVNCQQTSALDLDGDCIVNFYEFSAMAENWRGTIIPSSPANLTITAAGAASVSLDWDDNSRSFLAGYNVYRSTTSGSGYSKLNTSLLTSSNYTDSTATNGVTYYYVVTAVDIYSSESGYSNEVSRLVIQENTTGFCSVDGYIPTPPTYSGYTGTSYADTYNTSGVGVNWRISVPSSGTYTFSWRYAATSSRPAKLLVNGSEVVSSISFPSTGSWTTWSLVSVNVPLTAGTKDIRLEATGVSGLANIDYLMVFGGSASLLPVSCTP